MTVDNFDDGSFLTKTKKSTSRFKNNKRRYNESVEMQSNRARRVNFKNYLREIEEEEFDQDIDYFESEIDDES